LYGPGKAIEHADPHLAAAFSDPQELEPDLRPDGLRPGAARKRRGPHDVEHAVRRAQLCAGVAAALLASEPFAVQQMGTGEFRADRAPGQVPYRLAVEDVGPGVGGQQRTRPGQHA
jgi:hypothetical protein